jgi:hypothetical protein
VVVVGPTVVVGAVVVGARVVVGRGAAVVGGAVVAGRVLGGVVCAEVRGADGGGARAATVEVVVLGRRTVVRGVPRLPAPAAATTPTVVVAGHGRPPQAPGAGSPKAWSVRTTTIPAVATPVASHGRRSNRASVNPVDSRRHPGWGSATLPFGGPGNGG